LKNILIQWGKEVNEMNYVAVCTNCKNRVTVKISDIVGAEDFSVIFKCDKCNTEVKFNKNDLTLLKVKPFKISNERVAISQSIKMWKYLATFPEDKKEHYFMSYNINYHEDWRGDCACCEYYQHVNERFKCTGCPLDNDALCAIAKEGSAFSDWYDENNTKESAEIILYALQKYWNDNFKGNRKKSVYKGNK